MQHPLILKVNIKPCRVFCIMGLRDAGKENGKRVTLSLLPLAPPPSLRVTSLKSDKVVFPRPPPFKKE